MNETDVNIRIVNLSCEAFNDALFFKEQASLNKNYFESNKYKRAALVFFCISAEAMIDNLITCNLTNKKEKENLTKEEENVLKFLTDEEYENIPKELRSIKKKLIFLLNSTGLTGITFEDLDCEFKKYFELSQKRNAVVHYSSKRFKDVYSYIDKWINDAPDIIENLFSRYYEYIKDKEYLIYCCKRKCSKDEFLNWFKKRKYEEIT